MHCLPGFSPSYASSTSPVTTTENMFRYYQMLLGEQNSPLLRDTDFKEFYPQKYEWLGSSFHFSQCFCEFSFGKKIFLYSTCYNSHCELIHDFFFLCFIMCCHVLFQNYSTFSLSNIILDYNLLAAISFLLLWFCYNLLDS